MKKFIYIFILTICLCSISCSKNTPEEQIKTFLYNNLDDCNEETANIYIKLDTIPKYFRNDLIQLDHNFSEIKEKFDHYVELCEYFEGRMYYDKVKEYRDELHEIDDSIHIIISNLHNEEILECYIVYIEDKEYKHNRGIILIDKNDLSNILYKFPINKENIGHIASIKNNYDNIDLKFNKFGKLIIDDSFCLLEKVIFDSNNVNKYFK